MKVYSIEDDKLQHDHMLQDCKNLLKRLENHWKLNIALRVSEPINKVEISTKQKEYYRDIFANITTKRIVFQYDKRLLFLKSHSSEVSEISSIPDAVLLPINSEEIQSVLTIAQNSDLKISVLQRLNHFVETSNLLPKAFCGLSVELMEKILKFSPEKYSITVQSGLKLYQLIKFLEEKSWRLTFDTTGLEDLTVYESIFYHHLASKSILGASVHTPQGVLRLEDDNDGLLNYFLNEKIHSGVFSEFTLEIQPKERYIRKVEASIYQLSQLTNILQQLRENNIDYRNICLVDSKNQKLLDSSIQISKSDNKDLFQTIFGKKESTIKTEQNENHPFVLEIDLDEYHYNISSKIVKIKDIIHSVGAQVTSSTSNLIHKWRSQIHIFNYLSQQYELDCFYLSRWIPLSKLENVYRELDKKLSSTKFYAPHKFFYQIVISEVKNEQLRVEVFFIAPSTQRKSEDAFKELKLYINEILKPISKPKEDFYLDVMSLLQNKFDPKQTLLKI